MHTGDGDAVLQAHQFGQHLGALDYGNVKSTRFRDLQIIGWHGGTGYHDFGAGDILRLMTFKNGRSQSGQSLCDYRTLQVGAGNLVSQIEQHFGDAAHADAADTYEMYALYFGKHELRSRLRIGHLVGLFYSCQPCRQFRDISCSVGMR